MHNRAKENHLNWEVIASTGEWAGAIAVVITLFYLASQIRQQNKISRFSVVQTCQSEFNQFNRMFVEDPKRNLVFIKGLEAPDSLTDAETLVFQQLIRIPYNTALTAFNGYKQGLIPEEDWLVWARWFASYFYQLPGGIRFRELNETVTPDFFEELANRIPSAPYGDMKFGREVDFE